MPPTHHPGAEALANFMIGNCSPGEALLISRHRDGCALCAGRMRNLWPVRGAAGEVTYGEPRSLGRGIEQTPLLGASGLGEAVFLIKLAPGCALPSQDLGRAEILLLDGELRNHARRYGPCDFISLGSIPMPHLVSHETKGCVCLVAADDIADDIATMTSRSET